jgi:hypothetical protein
MSSIASHETGETLVALARQNGHRISQTQLARWHRVGLLPRPRQLPLKTARGTCSCYPDGTGKQLLALCSLRATERRLAHLAWQLWLAGYPVALPIIRAHLAQAAQRIDRWLVWFKRAIKTPDMPGEIMDLLERFAQEDVPFPPLRRIRKRIGREHFPTFLRMLIELATETEDEATHRDDQYERLIDLHILARGLGLEKRFVQRNDTLAYYLAQVVIPQLRWVLAQLQAVDWKQIVEHATDFDLLQTRDELCSWMMRWGKARQYWDRLPADYPRWQIDTQQMFSSLSTADQALILVGWLALRTS